MCLPRRIFLCLYHEISLDAFRWSKHGIECEGENVPHLHCVNSETALDCRELRWLRGSRRRWNSRQKSGWFSLWSSFYIFSEQRTSKLLRHKLSSRSSVGGKSKRHFRQSLFYSLFTFTHFLCGGNVNIFCCVSNIKELFLPEAVLFPSSVVRLQVKGENYIYFCRKNSLRNEYVLCGMMWVCEGIDEAFLRNHVLKNVD